MKNITICVTGSIAIYKVMEIISNLKEKFNINIIMSKTATKFINPILFETLTKNKVIIDMFESNINYDINHISIAKSTDLLLICPATANIISKIANGIADDMITTTILSVKCPVIIAPAMNTNMYNNTIIKKNILILKKVGYIFVNSICGKLACGDIGDGKLAKCDTIISYINYSLKEKDLNKKKILITAGPTREKLDPIRFLTNLSSGKMGYAIAQQAMLRGADVTLIAGPNNLKNIPMIKIIKIYSADDMYNAVIKNYKLNNFIIKTAAVSDYKFLKINDHKLKKTHDSITINLTINKDILYEIGKLKLKNQIICGFCMETKNIINNAYKKLQNKNCDLIVANNIINNEIGFGSDINTVDIISKNGKRIHLIKKSKYEIADIILDKMLDLEKKLNKGKDIV